ncbi:hypothetical protein [Thermococcus sp. JCM 11816]|uniref:hypothetical protein n=1 Tax=Thermococcus sp. (strain JCM 11816 / KS-1) TaxID=1295125 RepID=UPI0034656959
MIVQDNNAYTVEKKSGKYNVKIDLAHLKKIYPKLYEQLTRNFEESREALISAFSKKFEGSDVVVYFINSPLQKRLHDIDSSDFGKFVTVRGGVISALSEKKGFLRKSAYVCKDCGQLHTLMQFPYMKQVRPNRCSACGSKNLILSQEDSLFVDYRRMTVEDSFEELKNKESKETFNAYMLYPPSNIDEFIGHTVELTVIVRNTSLLKESVDSTSDIILEIVGINEANSKLPISEQHVKELLNLKKSLSDEEFLYRMITMIDLTLYTLRRRMTPTCIRVTWSQRASCLAMLVTKVACQTKQSPPSTF